MTRRFFTRKFSRADLAIDQIEYLISLISEDEYSATLDIETGIILSENSTEAELDLSNFTEDSNTTTITF